MPEAPESPPPRRLWLLLTLGLALAALLEAIALGFEPLPIGLGHRILSAALPVLLMASMLRAGRSKDRLRVAGAVLAALAGMAATLMSGFFEESLHGLQLGLHLAAGAGLLGAVTLWACALRPKVSGPTGDKEVLLLEAGAKGPKKSKATLLVSGQRIELLGRAGVVPIDGRILEGEGRVELGSLFEGAKSVEKRAGEVLLAGSRTEQPFVLEVVDAPGRCLKDRIVGHARALSERAQPPGWRERVLAAGVLALAVAAFALSLVRHPEAQAFDHLGLAGVLGLLAIGAAPGLALSRARLEALRLLFRRGVYLADEVDLKRLLGRARFAVTPELVAAPGRAEVVSLSASSPEELLQVAAALCADEDGPVAVTLRAELARAGVAGLRSAALRRTQAVLYGTVGGARWFMGPALAVKEEEKVSLDPGGSPFFDSLAARFPVVLVLGRPDEGLVGILGVSFERDPVMASVGEALGASLAPGQPDVVREAIAGATGLDVRARPARERDLTIIRFRDLPPSAGLALRVAKEAELLGHELGELSVVAEPALPGLPETIDRSRRLLRRGRLRAVLVVLGIALGLFAVAWLPGVPPLVAAAWSLFLLSSVALS